MVTYDAGDGQGGPLVSIVIVNWNGINDTVECLQSVLKIRYHNYRIIIVDNGSANNEAKKLRLMFNDPRISIIELKRNLGFAIASNVGIRISLQQGADYIMLLNNDTIVDEQFMIRLLKAAEGSPRIGILSPKIYYYHDRKRIWYAGGKTNLYFRHKIIGICEEDRGQYDLSKETDYVLGACMLIKRMVFERIGLLAREYFYGPDDVDFCIRATRNGFICYYVAQSVIWHKESGSIKRHNMMKRKLFYIIRNAIMLKYKFLNRAQFVLSMCIFLSVNVPAFTIFHVMRYRDATIIRAILAGIRSGCRDMSKRPTRLIF